MATHDEFADNAELVQLSAPRAQRLLVIFDRARQLAPLVVVLAIIPGLYAVAHRELTEADAEWGMHALDVLRQHDALWHETPERAWSEVFAAQPPLGAILDAVALQALGTRSPLALVLTSYVSFALLLYAVYLCFRTVCSERFALLVTLLAASHGPLLEVTQRAMPLAAGLMTGCFALWLMLLHLGRRPGSLSWTLPASAFFLGLCLLTAGMMALLFVVLVLLKAALDKVSAPESEASSRRRPRRYLAIGIWCALALAFGGWWCVEVYIEQGLEGLFAWAMSTVDTRLSVTGMDPAAARTAEPYAVYVLQFLALPGLILLGIASAVRTCLQSQTAQQTLLLWLLCWFGGLLAIWGSLVLIDGRQTFLSEGARLLALIGGMALAAVGIEEVCNRRVSPLVVAVVGCVTLVCLQLNLRLLGRPAFSLQMIVLLLGVFIIAIVRTRLPATRIFEDEWLRVALTGLLVLTVVANAMLGTVYLTPLARPIRQLQQALKDVDVDRAFLVSAESPPRRLQFTLQRLTPTRELWMLRRGTELREAVAQSLAELTAGAPNIEHESDLQSNGAGAERDQREASEFPRFLIVFWGPRRIGDLRISDVDIKRQLETILLDGNALHVFVASPSRPL